MIVGVPKEIKNHEYRVGLTPSGVRELCQSGHQVLVQAGSGLGIGIDNKEYEKAGASIVDSASTIFNQAELIIKVKEPQPSECQQLSQGQLLFTYLHLAADAKQASLLVQSGSTAIAYETITNAQGGLPLLTPMSEVAGRMSIQAGAYHLEKAQGGNGVLLGGVPGVAPAEVLVLGGGIAGLNAARVALGMGAHVTIMDININRLRQIDETFNGQINTLFSTTDSIERELTSADMVVGAVLIPGACAPKLIKKSMLSIMKKGAVLVDIAIDQGGCFETSRPTTHAQPTFIVDDVIHYCVANMPGAVARTSTFALTNATLPFVKKLAQSGINALKTDPHFLQGLNVHQGKITNQPVANALGYDFYSPESI